MNSIKFPGVQFQSAIENCLGEAELCFPVGQVLSSDLKSQRTTVKVVKRVKINVILKAIPKLSLVLLVGLQ